MQVGSTGMLSFDAAALATHLSFAFPFFPAALRFDAEQTAAGSLAATAGGAARTMATMSRAETNLAPIRQTGMIVPPALRRTPIRRRRSREIVIPSSGIGSSSGGPRGLDSCSEA